MCGEYGSINKRPHYHAIIFNYGFPDRSIWCKSEAGNDLFVSDELRSLWRRGDSYVGSVTAQSAAYVARYSLKKVTGSLADGYYLSSRCNPLTGEIFRLLPEFTHMSLKPGIGAAWFKKFASDVYSLGNDRVIIDGKEARPPRYYDKLLTRYHPFAFKEIKIDRLDPYCTVEAEYESSAERLAVKEINAQARIKFLKRSL